MKLAYPALKSVCQKPARKQGRRSCRSTISIRQNGSHRFLHPECLRVWPSLTVGLPTQALKGRAKLIGRYATDHELWRLSHRGRRLPARVRWIGAQIGGNLRYEFLSKPFQFLLAHAANLSELCFV